MWSCHTWTSTTAAKNTVLDLIKVNKIICALFTKSSCEKAIDQLLYALHRGIKLPAGIWAVRNEPSSSRTMHYQHSRNGANTDVPSFARRFSLHVSK